MELHIIGMIYVAKLYIYIGVGSRDLFIDKAHTALDIFRFAVFFDILLDFVKLYLQRK